MNRFLPICFLLTFYVFVVVGCSRTAQDIVPSSPVTLYSLDGKASEDDMVKGNGFGGFPVLGSVEIKDVPTRKKLVTALNAGITESDGTMAKCFWPRHAIEMDVDGKPTRFIICFECLQIKIVAEGEEDRVVATTNERESLFDEVLKAAAVELAPKS